MTLCALLSSAHQVPLSLSLPYQIIGSFASMSLTVPGSSMAQPEWQNLLKERMMAQQSQDEVHKELIGNCERCCDEWITDGDVR